MADILAGLSIVFERLYLVGDVVRIGDFKGTVVEIGVRSTKVVNDAKDVKIISNREIGNVINYSKLTSVCRVMITLPATVSIDDLEKQFEKELPLVAGTNPYIVRGPEFDGIQEFTGSSMVISVSAEGPEEHIDEIRCDLNRALQAMADKWSR